MSRASRSTSSRPTPCRIRTRWTTVSCRSAGSGYEGTCQPRIRSWSERSYRLKPAPAGSVRVYETAGSAPCPSYSRVNGPISATCPARYRAVSAHTPWTRR